MTGPINASFSLMVSVSQKRRASLLLLVMTLASNVRADSVAPPRDYVQGTPNGQFELVMLPTVRYARKNPALRKLYRQSGLYRKGAPQKPLWTLDWYAWNVYPASDGHHLVRIGPWPSSAEELVVAFYRDGRLLRQLKINQLVKDPESLPHSVSHLEWSKTISYNDAKRQLRVTTLGGEKYLFDANGQLVEGKLVPAYVPKSPADGFFHKGDLAGLIKLGSTAFPEIREAIGSGAGKKQQVAFLALCANGKAALPQLEILSHDEKAPVRQLVADGLLQISAPEGKPILLELLRDREPSVRTAAIAGLFQIHEDAPESPAIQAALEILRSGSESDKGQLLFALRDFRVPTLVPAVLPLLESQSREARSPMTLAARADSWLSDTTFQNFGQFDETRDSPRKIAGQWRDWWANNREKSSDEWFAQAIERDLASFSGTRRTGALTHLHQLSGQSFDDDDNDAKSAQIIAQWKAWWQKNKGRRAGQVLIASIAAPRKDEFSVLFEALSQLPRQTDAHDVDDLVALYLSSDPLQRPYVEVALRRITNVDSFKTVLADKPADQAIIQQWKRFVSP